MAPKKNKGKSALKKTVQKKSGDSDHDYDNDDYTLNEFEEAQLREAILTSKEEYESKNSMQEEETIFSSNDTITNDVDQDMEADQEKEEGEEKEEEEEEEEKSSQPKKSNVKRKKSGIQEFKQDNKNLNKRL